MSKDPAFLFYSNNFLSGVSDLTMEERGQFITLLCLQHQKGHLSEKTIRLSVGSPSVDVLKKFEKDEHGFFFNRVLDEKIEERLQFTASRRLNGMKGGRPKASGYPNGKPKNNHTINANENINEDLNSDEIGNFLCPEMFEIWKKFVPNYPGSQDKDYKPLFSIAKFFCKIGKLSGSPETHREKVIEVWEIVAKVAADDNFYKQKPLSTISNQIQELTQIALHGKSNGKPNYGSKERAAEYDRLFAERYGKGRSTVN